MQLSAREEKRRLTRLRADLHIRRARRSARAAARLAAASLDSADGPTHGSGSGRRQNAPSLAAAGAKGTANVSRRTAAAADEEDEAIEALVAELEATKLRLRDLVHSWTRWQQSAQLAMQELRERRSRWRAVPGAVAAAKLVTPDLVNALLDHAGSRFDQLPPRKLAHLLWAAPWLGYRPCAEWAAAAARRIEGCLGELSMMDACMLLWASARLQHDLQLPRPLLRAVVEHTQRLLLAAAPAGRRRAAAAGAAALTAAAGAGAGSAAADRSGPATNSTPAAASRLSRAPRPTWPPPTASSPDASSLHPQPATTAGAAAAAAAAAAAPPESMNHQQQRHAMHQKYDFQYNRAAPTAAVPSPAAAPALSPQDAVMLPWALAELDAQPGPGWVAAYCGAARHALRAMSGLQIGIMLRSLAVMRLSVPPGFIEAADTLASVNSATWEPGVCALVSASALQLRQLNAVAAAEAAAAAAAGGAAADGCDSPAAAAAAADDDGYDANDSDAAAAAAAAARQAEAEWELLSSLGIMTPLSLGSNSGDLSPCGSPLVTHFIHGTAHLGDGGSGGWQWRVPAAGR